MHEHRNTALIFSSLRGPQPPSATIDQSSFIAVSRLASGVRSRGGHQWGFKFWKSFKNCLRVFESSKRHANAHDSLGQVPPVAASCVVHSNRIDKPKPSGRECPKSVSSVDTPSDQINQYFLCGHNKGQQGHSVGWDALPIFTPSPFIASAFSRSFRLLGTFVDTRPMLNHHP